MKVTKRGVAAGVGAFIVAAVCIRLGFWQLDRLDQRRAFNAAAAAGLSQPPIRLDSATFEEIRARPEDFVHRRAIARGTYDNTHTVLLRGRAQEGVPGVHLITPLRLSDAPGTLLVNRGWIPSPDAATADPRPLTAHGPRSVLGVLLLVPESGSEARAASIALPDTTISSYRRLDYSVLAAEAEPPLWPLYLQRIDSTAVDPPVPVPLPTMDEGPHLSYAVQWFSFAAIAILGYLFLLVRLARRPDQDPTR